MRRWLVGSIVLLIAATGLQAGFADARNAPAAPLDLRYAMYLGGFHVADLELLHQENGPSGYRTELKTRTVGAAELLMRYRARASVELRKRAVLFLGVSVREKGQRADVGPLLGAPPQHVDQRVRRRPLRARQRPRAWGRCSGQTARPPPPLPTAASRAPG